MSEYIDRDMAIDVVARWFKEINLNGDICIDGLNSLPAVDVAKGVIEYWKKEGFIPSCDMVRTPHYAIHGAPAADVVERKTGKNVATEYDDCDQFVCSECGIELQDWRRVEHDEDGLEVYHEYRLRFCPNCGAQMIGGDDDV